MDVTGSNALTIVVGEAADFTASDCALLSEAVLAKDWLSPEECEAWDDGEPNVETLAAMEEADSGGLQSFDTVDELLADCEQVGGVEGGHSLPDA